MPFRAIFHMSYRRTRRADDTLVARLLEVAGVCRKTELGGELDAILRQGMSDCRDLFVLRGVRRPKRLTVLRLAARSIGQDRDCAARLEGISPGQAASLLRAVCLLMDNVGRNGFPPKSLYETRARAAKPALPVVAPAAATVDTQDLVVAVTDVGVAALKEASHAMHQGAVSTRRIRGQRSGDRRATVRPVPAAPALLAA
jgi:hypothetical protein